MTPTLLSKTKNLQERDSNIELLRIIAILLVMVVHASFLSLGAPTSLDVSENLNSAFLRNLSESLSIICVNIFILISGWFGIKAKPIRLAELIFQIYFFCLIIYFAMRLIGIAQPMTLNEWSNLILIRNGAYWFLRSYILLYIFAPVLNDFISNCNEKRLRNFLFAFFAFQTVYGFLVDYGWFNSGYSPLSFMGLYMLARYIKLYPNKYTSLNKFADLGIYLLLSLITTILSLAIVSIKGIDPWSYKYSSPLVILSSVHFVLFFTKVSFNNRFINWISISSISAYLVHCNAFILDNYYLHVIKNWNETENTILFLIKTAILILLIFSLSILLDKIRILVWKAISKTYQKCSFFHFTNSKNSLEL